MEEELIICDGHFDVAAVNKMFCTSIFPGQTFVASAGSLFLLEKVAHPNAPFMSVLCSTDAVLPTASVAVLSQFDPVFLCLAYFSEVVQRDVFEPLESHPLLQEISSVYPQFMDRIDDICATKQFGSMTVLKVDEQRVQQYFERKWKACDQTAVIRDLVATRLRGKYLDTWLSVAANAKKACLGPAYNKSEVTVIGDVLEGRTASEPPRQVDKKGKSGQTKKAASQGPPAGTRSISSFFGKKS
eukprot:ANDGO_01886.mRNA.1 hypothetical protein